MSYKFPRYVDGLPLTWHYEVSGKLKDAVTAYLESNVNSDPRRITDEQISMLGEWLRYYINAPAWCDDGHHTLTWLREQADSLNSVSAINRWIGKALTIGIDPL